MYYLCNITIKISTRPRADKMVTPSRNPLATATADDTDATDGPHNV